MRWGRLLWINCLSVAGVLMFAPRLSTSLARLASLPGSNPPVRGDMLASPDVAALLRRACYDCHSNETRWPWYSRVAPLSWLIAHDVERGRQELNFSEWPAYLPVTRKRKWQWIERVLHEQAMPPELYRLVHPDARLTEQDITLLEHWLQGQLGAGQISQHEE